MAKRISLSLCLLSGILLRGTPIVTAMPTAQGSPNLLPVPQGVAQETASSTFKLTEEDLPPGFQKLPPELTASIASQFALFSQQFRQANLNPEDIFAFVNPESFQVILGFTSPLPNEPEQASFDASLQQLQQPASQQLLIDQLKKSLQVAGGVKVLEYKFLPELNNLADTSTGFTLGIDMQGQPMQLDMATFRRGEVAAFTAVIYLMGETPLIQVGDVVRKLDSRILKVSAHSKLWALAE
ncbi:MULTISPECIES: hypothetical protein [unclassified Coleofasciculus]|uniref:hypothetical protein n=1 Tax=unclassified Coleofasciculus TaxID=2692782 RepID=UPI001882CE03|nr:MULTISPECIES: hypothetical protein [unclassified Coleofasciculus]MBE9128121.1 hypothetical protein [Coleofasciculus sp. LEGE 07081]MBE9151193.1 hypothetical protein [Coleofasciculus sp. LEGE 07092]